MSLIFNLVFVNILSIYACSATVFPSLYEIERPEIYHQVKPTASSSMTPKCDGSFLNGTYTLENPVFCDQFFVCVKGSAFLFQCEDGYAYVPFLGCKLLHVVDCSKRNKLQTPKGSGLCRRQNGIQADPAGCGRFVVCEGDQASTGRCPPKQSFDDATKVCGPQTSIDRIKCDTVPGPAQPIPPEVIVTSVVSTTTTEPALQVIVLQSEPPPSSTPASSLQVQPVQEPVQPTPGVVQPVVPFVEPVQTTPRPYVESSFQFVAGYSPNRPASSPQSTAYVPLGCPTTGPCDPALANFKCPTGVVLQFGDHARYPYFNSCEKFIICYRDHSFRVAGCEAGLAFDRQTKVCVAQQFIAGCGRKPAPVQSTTTPTYLQPSQFQSIGSPNYESVVFSFGRPPSQGILRS